MGETCIRDSRVYIINPLSLKLGAHESKMLKKSVICGNLILKHLSSLFRSFSKLVNISHRSCPHGYTVLAVAKLLVSESRLTRQKSIKEVKNQGSWHCYMWDFILLILFKHFYTNHFISKLSTVSKKSNCYQGIIKNDATLEGGGVWSVLLQRGWGVITLLLCNIY